MRYEWKAYGVNIKLGVSGARLLERIRQTWLYEQDWLCGKPVGGLTNDQSALLLVDTNDKSVNIY